MRDITSLQNMTSLQNLRIIVYFKKSIYDKDIYKMLYIFYPPYITKLFVKSSN